MSPDFKRRIRTLITFPAERALLSDAGRALRTLVDCIGALLLWIIALALFPLTAGVIFATDRASRRPKSRR
ncbi:MULTISPECIES: hypothetical protein [unclassified Caballeronia]|uniref:hypothetical protein n=1 Tax=unclassified Caballeronia TaxID=2646786 RepID=UPI00202852FF|nr:MULTISPECIES: hypothetical protein [unclassified Caballeronia]MDR5797455.1 hypothetical protein [Caballeronia sp. LZ008]